MSIETEPWRKKLITKRLSKKSLNEIIMYSLNESPKTIGEIMKSIAVHRTILPSRKQLTNLLYESDHIIEFESMVPPNEFSKSLNGSATPLKYGLLDKLTTDLRSNSEDLLYINRSTFIHLTKNRESDPFNRRSHRTYSSDD